MIALQDLEFTQASQAEWATVLEWAREEGWNPGLHDAASFYTADTHACYLAKYRGEAIASLSAVQYGAEFAFIGLYITRPAYRNQGCGYALWQHVMQQKRGSVLGLDGVVAQQSNYQRSGFRLAHRNIRFQGGHAAHLVSPDYQLCAAQELDFSDLLAYDQAHFLYPRAAFLRAWIEQAGAQSICLIDKQKIAGFAVLRPCWQGYKIGPLFATEPQQARALLQASLADKVADQQFILDVPASNQAALKLMDELQWQACFETARMYAGQAPALPLQNIYGITSFELG